MDRLAYQHKSPAAHPTAFEETALGIDVEESQPISFPLLLALFTFPTTAFSCGAATLISTIYII